MAGTGTPEVNLQAENLRLAEQVRVFSGDEHIRREAAPWRDATPAKRVAETWCLCALTRGSARADAPEPLPASTLAILDRLKQAGDGK